jgi:hypothetical protein
MNESTQPGTVLASFPKRAIEAEIRGNATLRQSGTGCRAEALPKVRTLFEDAHRFRKVRILENPDVSFEEAHPFPRCAPKTAHLRRWAFDFGERSPTSTAGARAVSCG